MTEELRGGNTPTQVAAGEVRCIIRVLSCVHLYMKWRWVSLRTDVVLQSGLWDSETPDTSQVTSGDCYGPFPPLTPNPADLCPCHDVMWSRWTDQKSRKLNLRPAGAAQKNNSPRRLDSGWAQHGFRSRLETTADGLQRGLSPMTIKDRTNTGIDWSSVQV